MGQYIDISRSIEKSAASGLEPSFLVGLYTVMLRIRMVEETIADLVMKDLIVCPCHLYIGQEAVATGVCSALTSEDYVFSTHRSHGHYIAKGGELKPLFAEIFGRATGCSKGHGGSMHLVAPEIGYMGSSAIVGGSIPLAVGAALAFNLKKKRNVAVTFFGDGAATEGVLYECLNFATLTRAPVIFICENNFYSTHMHISTIQSNVNVYEKAESFNLRSLRVNGYDVIEVYKATKDAIEETHNGNGPTFIEFITYRWRGHVGPKWDIEKGLRSQEEVDWWVNNCAVKKMGEFLLDEDLATQSEMDAIEKEILVEIEQAIAYATESPYPSTGAYRNKVFIE